MSEDEAVEPGLTPREKIARLEASQITQEQFNGAMQRLDESINQLRLDLGKRLQDVDFRLGVVEGQTNRDHDRIRTLEKEQVALAERLGTISQDVKQRLDNARHEMQDDLREFEAKIVGDFRGYETRQEANLADFKATMQDDFHGFETSVGDTIRKQVWWIVGVLVAFGAVIETMSRI